MRRPMVATTIDDDCSICGDVIGLGEAITELSAGVAHVTCYSKSLPADRYTPGRALKRDGWQRSPGSYRPGAVG